MRTSVRPRVACLWIVAALAVVPMASAQNPDNVEKEKAAKPRGRGGLQISVDPATGRLRTPTPEEARELAASMGLVLGDTSEGLEEVVFPDGTVVVDLEGRFMSVAVAAIDDDGTVVTECITDPVVAAVLMADDAEAQE